MANEEDLYKIDISDEDLGKIGQQVSEGKVGIGFSVNPKVILSTILVLLKSAPSFETEFQAAKKEIEQYRTNHKDEIPAYQEAWIYVKHMGPETLKCLIAIIGLYGMKQAKYGSEKEAEGSLGLYETEVIGDNPYLVSGKVGEERIIIPMEYLTKKPETSSKYKHTKDVVLTSVGIVAGLSLLNLVSNPSKTMEAVNVTGMGPNMIYFILAVVFFGASYLFLKKPMMEILRKS